MKSISDKRASDPNISEIIKNFDADYDQYKSIFCDLMESYTTAKKEGDLLKFTNCFKDISKFQNELQSSHLVHQFKDYKFKQSLQNNSGPKNIITEQLKEIGRRKYKLKDKIENSSPEKEKIRKEEKKMEVEREEEQKDIREGGIHKTQNEEAQTTAQMGEKNRGMEENYESILKAKENDVTKMRVLIERLRQQLLEQKIKYSGEESQMAETKKEIHRIKEVLKDKDEGIKLKKRKIKELEHEASNLREKLEEFARNERNQREKIGALEEKCRDLSQSLEDRDSRNERTEETLENHRRKIQSLEFELNEKDNIEENLTCNLVEKEEEAQNLRDRLSICEDRLEDAGSNLKQTRESLEIKEEKYEELKSSAKEILRCYKSTNSNIKLLAESYEEKILNATKGLVKTILGIDLNSNTEIGANYDLESKRNLMRELAQSRLKLPNFKRFHLHHVYQLDNAFVNFLKISFPEKLGMLLLNWYDPPTKDLDVSYFIDELANVVGNVTDQLCIYSMVFSRSQLEKLINSVKCRKVVLNRCKFDTTSRPNFTNNTIQVLSLQQCGEADKNNWAVNEFMFENLLEGIGNAPFCNNLTTLNVHACWRTLERAKYLGGRYGIDTDVIVDSGNWQF